MRKIISVLVLSTSILLACAKGKKNSGPGEPVNGSNSESQSPSDGSKSQTQSSPNVDMKAFVASMQGRIDQILSELSTRKASASGASAVAAVQAVASQQLASVFVRIEIYRRTGQDASDITGISESVQDSLKNTNSITETYKINEGAMIKILEKLDASVSANAKIAEFTKVNESSTYAYVSHTVFLTAQALNLVLKNQLATDGSAVLDKLTTEAQSDDSAPRNAARGLEARYKNLLNLLSNLNAQKAAAINTEVEKLRASASSAFHLMQVWSQGEVDLWQALIAAKGV